MKHHEQVAAALAAQRPVLGVWTRGEVASVAACRDAELDFVVLDCQHSDLDEADVARRLVKLHHPTLVRVARVSRNEDSLIGRLADAGAHYIIVPMISSAAEARAAVEATLFAPDGRRSFGPFHEELGRIPQTVSDQVGILAMIETRAALESIEAIVAVPGLAGVFVGPADLAISLGRQPATALAEPDFVAELEAVAHVGRRAGLLTGIHATSGKAAVALGKLGYNLLTLGNERTALAHGLQLARADVLKSVSTGCA